MKRIFVMILLVSMFLTLPIMASVVADTDTHPVQLYPEANNEHTVFPDPEGKRKPMRPLAGVIDRNSGVWIEGIKKDIICFEVWEATEENCIASFISEDDFISFIFNEVSATVKIRLQTEDAILHGFLYI